MPNKILHQFNNNSKTAFIGRLFITLSVMAAIAYGALFYFDFLNASAPRFARKPAKEQAATVDILVIDFEDVQPLISNFGQIITAKQLPLSASVGGRVKYISDNFKVGAVVKTGELLFELDNFEYQGNLMSAKANLQDITFKSTDIDNQVNSTEINYNSTLELYDNAKEDYEGSVKLQKSGIISKQALDDKNQALIQQKQSLDSMAASFANLKNQKLQLLATTEMQQWAVTKAEKDLDSTKIYAPFDAYIHNASLELGQHIGANSTVATLLDQQKIDVKFTLSDGQYGRIIAQDGTIIGREIRVIWKIGQIEKTFEAVINRVNSEIVAASGGIDLYASIINVEAVEALRIGAFVKVLIPDQTYEQIIKIPDYMIYDNDIVYVVARVDAEDALPVEADDKQQKPATGDKTLTNAAVQKAEENANIDKTLDGKTNGEKPTQAQGQGQRQKAAANRPANVNGNGNGQRPANGQRSANGQRGRNGQAQGQRANGGQLPAKSQGNADGQTDAQPSSENQPAASGENQQPNGSNQRPNGQSGGKKPDEELAANQKRLEPIKVQIIGYDGDQILIVNHVDVENPLQAGDALLQTRLTLAGKGVLVITSEESAKKQAAALEKLKARGANGQNGGNRRFGGRQQNPFGGGGGRRR